MTTKRDPLIAAVLAKIPGADSTRDQRIAWLRMAAMAMDNAYGSVGSIDIPDFLQPRPVEGTGVTIASSPAPAKPQVVRAIEPPRFFIDYAGAARQAPSMEAITPEQLGGDTIFDDRGEHGDLGSILWADGRRGVLGLQISISATPVEKRA